MKRQSSTTGISKTAESPPALRKEIIGYNQEDEDRYATYDPHFRRTIDAVGFQRGAGYRSSLQNMNSNDLAFQRHNRYRSTIQNGSIGQQQTKNGRYIYAGSITPTPKSRYLSDVTPRMTPG
jgi:hypothetical protein